MRSGRNGFHSGMSGCYKQRPFHGFDREKVRKSREKTKSILISVGGGGSSRKHLKFICGILKYFKCLTCLKIVFYK